jgi:hypothetical protein
MAGQRLELPLDGTLDVTSQIVLMDLGTEVDEPLGEGPNQAPRQPSWNTGADEHGVATPAPLDASRFLRITIMRAPAP